MLRKFALLVSATLVFAASGARAETYWLGGGGPRVWWFVDSDSIDKAGEHPRGWIVNVYRSAGPSYLGKKVVGTRTHLEVDCQGKRMRYLTSRPLDAQGIALAETPGGEAWLPVPPRTPGEAQLNYLCGYGRLLGAAPLDGKSVADLIGDWGAGKARAETLTNIGR